MTHTITDSRGRVWQLDGQRLTCLDDGTVIVLPREVLR